MSHPREHFTDYAPSTLDLQRYRRETPFLRPDEHRRIDRAYDTYRRLSVDVPSSEDERDLYEDCCELIYRVAHYRDAEAGDFGREDFADQIRGLLRRIEPGA